MGILKTRKNKKFGYAPRHYNNDGAGSPFQIEHRFDKFRTTIDNGNNLKAKFKMALEDFKSNSDKKTNTRVLLIISILILIFLFIIDFDLSIFFY